MRTLKSMLGDIRSGRLGLYVDTEMVGARQAQLREGDKVCLSPAMVELLSSASDRPAMLVSILVEEISPAGGLVATGRGASL